MPQHPKSVRFALPFLLLALGVTACDDSLTEPASLVESVQEETLRFQNTQVAAEAGYDGDGHYRRTDVGARGSVRGITNLMRLRLAKRHNLDDYARLWSPLRKPTSTTVSLR